MQWLSKLSILNLSEYSFAISKTVQEIGNFFINKQASDHDFKEFIIKIKTSQKTINKYL
jgi:hypothetical protein